MRLAALWALTVLLAGCSDSPAAAPEEAADPAPDDVPVPPPEPVLVAAELFNETLAYAHVGMGSNEASTFMLAEGARAVQATVSFRPECPVTTYTKPAVVLRAPDGSATEVPLRESASNSYACPFVESEFEAVGEVELPAAFGEWTVETTGECSCEARVAVTAQVPA